MSCNEATIKTIRTMGTIKGKMEKSVHLKLTSELYNSLKKEAKNQDRSLSNLIRLKLSTMLTTNSKYVIDEENSL